MADALIRAGRSLSGASNLLHCGEGWWVLRSRTEPDLYRLAPDRCHNRLCPDCARLRAQTIRRVLREHVEKLDGCRFVTLTLRSREADLTDEIDRLYRCFTLLRRRALWKRHVRGGAAFLEVTRSPETGFWHVHLHALTEGTFFPQSELAVEWERCTGDSKIVDIRYVRDPANVNNYVTKYVTKGIGLPPPTEPDDVVVTERIIRGLEHRKLCLTWGTWRGLQLTSDPHPGEWERLVHTNELFNRGEDDHRWPPGLVSAVRLALSMPGSPEVRVPWANPPPPDPDAGPCYPAEHDDQL